MKRPVWTVLCGEGLHRTTYGPFATFEAAQAWEPPPWERPGKTIQELYHPRRSLTSDGY